MRSIRNLPVGAVVADNNKYSKLGHLLVSNYLCIFGIILLNIIMHRYKVLYNVKHCYT